MTTENEIEQPRQRRTPARRPAKDTSVAAPPPAIVASLALTANEAVAEPETSSTTNAEQPKPPRRRAPRRTTATAVEATPPATENATASTAEAEASDAAPPRSRRGRSQRGAASTADAQLMAIAAPVEEPPLAALADAWEGVEAAPASPNELAEIERALAAPAADESVDDWELDDDQAVAFDPASVEFAEPGAATQAGEDEPAQRRRRRRGRRGRGRGAAAEAGVVDTAAAPPTPAPAADAPADGWTPRLPSYPVAFEPTPPPTKRRPARRPGSTTMPRFSPEEQREIDAFVTNGGAVRATAPEPVEATPLTPEEQQALESAASRPRRRRGGRKPAATEADALQVTPEFEPLPAAPARGGATVEALLARQNVILNAMLERQTVLLRNIERALVQLDQRSGGAAGAAASTPRVGVFVDVPNVMYAAERLGWNIDFGKLLLMLSRGRELVRASAYAPVSDDPQVRLETQRFAQPFIGRGYRLVTKPLKRFADGTMKGNFDVEMAMDMLTMADRLDIVCLISGDGDFSHLVETVEARGVRVEVAAFAASTSGDLRAVCDDFIDLTHRQREIAQ